jgi:Ca2+-binding RTX toxin-like protein
MALREIDGGPGYFSQFSNSLPTDPSYFPIGVWFESVTSQADINLDKAAGLNLYVVLTGGSNLSLIENNGMYAILQADTNTWRTNQAAINNPAVVGWVLGDEIDMTQGPGQGYTTLNNVLGTLPNDGRFHYSNYGKGVMFWETDAQAAQFVNDFQQVTSVDTYWFTDPNIDGGSEGGRLLNNGNPLTVAQTRLAANYGYTVDRMRELDAMDGQLQPIWAFVEVGWPFTETAAQGGRAIEPEEIKAAVWHSIIAGARGIIYFNHSFGGPDQTQHALRDPDYAAERAAVTSTDALINQLAPVLNAPFDDGFATVGPSVRVMAKFYDGVHYVFAGSTQNAAGTAAFTLAGVSSGTATVIDEGRTIPITNGQFVDNFANGDAIHIYQISTSVGGVLAGSISINDVTISEGNSGTKVATFTVTRSGGTAAFDVSYGTSIGTATVADSDYVAASGTLNFGANENTKTISVTINGDTKMEANETFNVVLSNATKGATISDSQGVGTITNDDAAAIAGSVSINNVTISEGDSGTKVATFTATRSGGTAAFDVNFATSNGTATVADSDYVAASNTLHFAAHQNTQTISVTINGDTEVEANETFNVVLSNATNGATISDSQGVGTITNDDGASDVTLIGTSGRDTLRGGAGDDTLNGEGGDDWLYGNDGDDTLIGGSANDQLFGGAGADVFVFTAASDSTPGYGQRDLIWDFQAGIDEIDLSAIDARKGESDNQSFSFMGEGTFDSDAAQPGLVKFHYDSAANRTLVEGTVDSSAGIDFQISLVGQHVLTAADFML